MAPPCVAIRSGSIAAGGGAGRRSAKNADRPMHQSREAHPLGLAAPLPRLAPRGALTSTAAQATDAKGSHPVRVGNDGGSPASSSRSAGAAHHLPFLDVGG
jgi:hypothetical protein